MENRPKRVLLFDEDYEAMHDLKEFMEEQLGWEVTLSAGAGILELLGHKRFDLILVDLMIAPASPDCEGSPVQNVYFEQTNWHRTGVEFVRRLRLGNFELGAGGTARDVPVIILSAVASDPLRNELKAAGIVVQDYVEKPFRLETLAERMQRL